MGVEAPENRLTCAICGRKFTKVKALDAHRKSTHKLSTITKQTHKTVRKHARVTTKSSRLLKKKVIKPKPNKTSIPMSTPETKTETTNTVNEVATEKTINLKKVLFKCPKCVKVFSVYFSAYKHIQKFHCVDENDKPVEPNSSFLIKPIRVESFEAWMPLKSTQETQTALEKEPERFMCLGCQKTHDNLELFEDHVKIFHSNGAEILFFPSNAEFGSWKIELETATRTKFVTRIPEKKTRQIYHCSHQPLLETKKTLLCPASLSITELKNGHQVIYYKEHFGHSCSELTISKYKKYSISSYFKDMEIKNVDTENNIYEQFKNIMNSITDNAINVDIGVLNTLLSKALEMTISLNTVNIEKEEQSTANKNMTDAQISQVLAGVKVYPAKRKSDTINKNIKKLKPQENNQDSISSPNSPLSKPNESLASITLKRTVLQSPPSFNDSYKDFVDQNCKTPVPVTPRRNAVKKKNIVKTKIGQFKPATSPKDTPITPLPKLSPKTSKQLPQTKSLTPSKTSKQEILPKTTKKALLTPNTTKAPQSPKPAKDILSPKPPKEILSSKPPKETLSPKKQTNKQTRFSTGLKLKPDIKYEVKEQENDCNILILKI